MVNWDERRLLVKAANLYYFDGWTQAQIAKKMSVSRPVISKMLNRARELGIVEIYIKDENAHTATLEHKLENLFGLKEAVVVPTSGLTPEMVKRSVGKAAAYYVSKHLDGIKSLGISWGTALYSMVNEYPYEQRSDLNIVPLVGGMGRKLVNIHSNLLAYQLAQKVNGTCSYLYAPAMVESEELKQRLIESEDIANVLAEGRQVEMALVGIGNPLLNSTMSTMEYLKEEDLVSLRKSGVVGDIGSRFFDMVGDQITHPLNDRVIGITLDELKDIPEVVGVAEGSHKVESLLIALKSNYLNVLIVDDSTAQSLVNDHI
ncbi:sugar-binding transcriptional regulator [Alkalicoccobacillus porphyridii]|uniref:Sugar-binding transcriptional regulator n=1 Tax=Alkalicoccobacillus porphyridii TaxID=2597270 RepID=A0A554A0T7_9BACI|nr:sugar-binding transcriptional regulator [Alkalicoccobacillus porphyridii]TSB47256.1 sugar-binding transcriptional regulator [Alkalicoccobacillus porphyridii]